MRMRSTNRECGGLWLGPIRQSPHPPELVLLVVVVAGVVVQHGIPHLLCHSFSLCHSHSGFCVVGQHRHPCVREGRQMPRPSFACMVGGGGLDGFLRSPPFRAAADASNALVGSSSREVCWGWLLRSLMWGTTKGISCLASGFCGLSRRFRCCVEEYVMGRSLEC